MTDTKWKMVGTGDFNNDGQLDILWRHATTGQNAVWYMNGSAYLSTATIQSVSDTDWEIVGTGYFNADGNIDLLWRNRVIGDNVIWFMNGVIQAGAIYLQTQPDVNWKVCAAGDSRVDTDADRLPDLWERNYFGNLIQNGVGDWDADGLSDLEEYWNGTSP